MRNCFDDRPLDYMKDLMAAALKVSKADVKRVLKKYVQPIFSPTTGAARIVVAANPAKVEQIVKGFEEMGLKVEQIDVDKIDVDELK